MVCNVPGVFESLPTRPCGSEINSQNHTITSRFDCFFQRIRSHILMLVFHCAVLRFIELYI